MAHRGRTLEKDEYEPNYFEWQAFSTLDGYNKQTYSPFFQFYRRTTALQMAHFSMNSNNYTAFVLCYHWGFHSCNIFHTTSIIDSEGKVCFNSNGRLVKGTGNVLMTLSSSYLQELQKKGNLTVHFKWFTNEGCDKGFHRCKDSIKARSNTDVLECATQTIRTRPTPTRDICTNTETEERNFLDNLSKDFGNLYEGKTDTDCVLRVGETKFPVHRSVLSARSTVFAAMFHHDTSESRSGEVVIQDVDADALGDVIYYIYTGKIRGLSSNTAASMYMIADRYCLIELRKECLNWLMHNLTVENVCDAAVLSHRHAEDKLENQVVQFIKDRLKELMECDKWKEFSDSHSKLANKFLCSILMANK